MDTAVPIRAKAEDHQSNQRLVPHPIHRVIGEVRDQLGIPFLTSCAVPSGTDNEVLADHPVPKAALATGDCSEIKDAMAI